MFREGYSSHLSYKFKMWKHSWVPLETTDEEKMHLRTWMDSAIQDLEHWFVHFLAERGEEEEEEGNEGLQRELKELLAETDPPAVLVENARHFEANQSERFRASTSH